VDKLMKAAGAIGRHGHRDSRLLFVAYRHGLRVSEVTSLRWDQVDMKQGLMHVNRVKNGLPSTHPIRGPELRALRRLKKEYEGPYVFSTEPRADDYFDRAQTHGACW
jgi:type 1 fimbriae regulatory protein FimB/type 1 fimbriae regulatory protein FimE